MRSEASIRAFLDRFSADERLNDDYLQALVWVLEDDELTNRSTTIDAHRPAHASSPDHR